jgi:hypothetical protein
LDCGRVQYAAAVSVDLWVEGGLEAVPNCPMCVTAERELIPASEKIACNIADAPDLP